MLRLAWRNVWRNRRRSLINVAAMGFGLAAIMFGQSLIISLQQQLVEKATGSITGHVRVQRSDVDESKFPDKFMADPEPAAKVLAADPRVAVWGRRIQVTGLISAPSASLGVLICAVEPEKEKLLTDMVGYLKEGTYLDPDKKGIVMGRKLANRLDVRLGEKVVVMSQASDGSMGAEAFRVVGIHQTGSESFDGQIVWLPLKAMQELLVRPGQANQLAARVKDITTAEQVALDVDAKLPPGPIRAISWKAIDREIISIQAFQNGILTIVLVIVFLIVALGILNTQLMSLFERVREFGVLMAIGARPRWVVRLILAESLVLGSVGALLGLTIGAALIAHFGRAGLRLPVGEAFSYFLPFPSVIYMIPAWRLHAFATFSVFLITLLASLPPALRAGRLKPAEALRHV
ncbi:MAG: ABC transporter permease [Elusimicrobiota bacterium]|nr:MAG: ABC transporter permease [Elusimicrobiota bacterium]